MQGLQKGGSKVMYKAPKARSASEVGGGECGRGYPPSHPFDVFLDKTLEMV